MLKELPDISVCQFATLPRRLKMTGTGAGKDRARIDQRNVV